MCVYTRHDEHVRSSNYNRTRRSMTFFVDFVVVCINCEVEECALQVMLVSGGGNAGKVSAAAW